MLVENRKVNMDGDHQTILTMSAAGRMFRPGMLYNAINDQPIPGFTLWDEDKTAIITTPQVHMDVGICLNDNFESKASIFDIDGELKLSIIAGIVEAEGSAKYLRDNKSSFKKHRAALYVKQTTKDREYRLPKLPVDSPEILTKKDVATHIVTSVTYGGYCVFLFEEDDSEAKTNDKVRGKLEASVKLAKTFLGKSESKLTPEEKNKFSKISCHFHGDLDIDAIPTTYEKALELIQRVPALIKASERPVKVKLFPLALYFGEERRIYHMISSDLVHQAGHYIQNLEDALGVADHLRKTEFCRNLSTIKKQLDEFYRIVSGHRRKVKQKIATAIPKIRRAEEGESELMHYLTLSQETSPFSSDSLVHWIQDKEKELRVLELWVRKFEEAKAQLFFNHSDLTVQLASQPEPVLVISFPSALQSRFIPALKSYLHKHTSGDLEDEVEEEDSCSAPSFLDSCWADCCSESANIEKDFWSLNAFLKTNSKDLAGRVFVSELSSPKSQQQFSFRKVIREQGKGEIEFEVPLPPKNIHFSDVSPKSVEVSWSVDGSEEFPQAVTGFVLQYKQKSQSGPCESLYEEHWGVWKSVEVHMEQKVAIDLLLPATEYTFRIKTKTPVGCSAWSPIVCHCTQPETSHALLVSEMCANCLPRKETDTFSGDIYELRKVDVEGFSRRPSLSQMLFDLTLGMDLPGASATPVEQPTSTRVKKFHVGLQQTILVSTTEIKTIWLVGEKGCGKKALIDAVANVYYGVEFKDNFRFTLGLSEAQEISPSIVEYTLHPVTSEGQEERRVANFSLKIVDIPSFTSSFKDTLVEEGGTQVHLNDVIVHNIEEYIGGKMEAPHAVAFVTNGTQGELTCVEKSAFGHLLSMFPKELKEMFIQISTFSLVGKRMHDLGVEINNIFAVDNSVLFQANNLEDQVGDDKQKLLVSLRGNQWKLNELVYQELLGFLRNKPTNVLQKAEIHEIQQNRRTLRGTATYVSSALQEALISLPEVEKAIAKYNCRRRCWQTSLSSKGDQSGLGNIKEALIPYKTIRLSMSMLAKKIQESLLYLSDKSISQYPAEAAVEFETCRKSFSAAHDHFLHQWVLTAGEPADIIHNVMTGCDPLYALTEQIVAMLRAGDVDELWPHFGYHTCFQSLCDSGIL